jgi:hypothetical protein
MKKVARNRSLAQIAFRFNRVYVTLVRTRIVYLTVEDGAMTTISLLSFSMQLFMVMMHRFVQQPKWPRNQEIRSQQHYGYAASQKFLIS